MGVETSATQEQTRRQMPIVAVDLPVLYEDEGQEEMGETDPHFESIVILRYGLRAHLADRPEYRVFSDLNLYYHPTDPSAYVSPDNMVVVPSRQLGDQVSSYHLRSDGPPPELVAEVLSRRSYQQQDTTNKPEIYAEIGVREYLLVDVSGQFLPERLLLKRLQPGGVWVDEQDADGGISSRLGFRVIVDGDGQLRVLDAASGRRYARPEEAEREREAREQEREARLRAEQELQRLRAELQQLRNTSTQPDGS